LFLESSIFGQIWVEALLEGLLGLKPRRNGFLFDFQGKTAPWDGSGFWVLGFGGVLIFPEIPVAPGVVFLVLHLFLESSIFGQIWVEALLEGFFGLKPRRNGFLFYFQGKTAPWGVSGVLIFPEIPVAPGVVFLVLHLFLESSIFGQIWVEALLEGLFGLKPRRNGFLFDFQGKNSPWDVSFGAPIFFRKFPGVPEECF